MSALIRKISQKRVLYARVFFTMLVLLVMILCTYLFANNIVHKHLLQNIENSLDYSQYQIQTILLESEIALDSFGRSVRNMLIYRNDIDHIQDFIDDMSDSMSGYMSGDETYSSSVKGFYGYFEQIAEGPVFLSGIDLALPEGFDPEQSVWYRDAVAANGDIVEILLNEEVAVEETLITYALCLYDDDNQRLGVVCADVIFNKITDSLANTAGEINGIGVLISSEMTVIYHNNPDFISLPMSNPTLPFSIFADALERGENVTEQPLVDYLGQQSVAFFRHLPNGWRLGLFIPKGPYYEPVTQMTTVLLIISAVFAAVLTFIMISTDTAYENTKLLVNMNPLAVHLWDRDCNIIDCNDESLRLFNMQTKEENIQRFFDLSPEYQPDGQQTRAKSISCIQKAFKNGGYKLEWMHQLLDGTPLPVEITLVRIPYKKDYLIAAFARDLRTQKKMMEDIHSALALLAAESSTIKTVFNLAPDLIFCKDTDLKYIRVNKSFLNFFGLTEDEIVGKDDLDGLTLPISLVDEHRTTDRKVMDERIMYTYEECVPDKYGNSRIFETSKLPMIQAGEVTGFVGIAHDVTRRKEIEESAFRANHAKSAFLANMSHEIRTPMNTILGIAEMQLQDDELADSIKESLNMIYNAGELLLGIINDLLDMSKIEANKFELAPARYETASLINDTMMLNMTRLGSKPIEFELDVEENVPTSLIGDELRIKQILNNILSNAFKYTKKGTIRFSVAAQHVKGRSGDMVFIIFKVADTGIGMSEDQIERLFDEYARFNMEANRDTQGTGLGMSITKNLVGKMDGEIVVVSKVGKGTEFTVRIPQTKISDDVLGKELVENLRLFRASGMKQIKRSRIVVEPMPYGKVLVVDDVESNSYVAKGLMKPYRLSVESVTSGPDAIRLIEKGNVYDIIFMDHMMPGMDGLEATSIIRGMGYTKPIVALTANAVVGQSDIFLSNGFDGFVAKPIDTRVLNSALKEFVRDKHSPEEIEAANREYAGTSEKEAILDGGQPFVNPEMAEIFLRDINKAIEVLEETCRKRESCTEDDIKSYVITTHSLKTMLANIGEHELSAIAKKLESTGRENGIAVILAETPGVITRLRTVMERLMLVRKEAVVDDDATDDDVPFLREKLLVVREACLEYNGKTAKAAVSELRQKKWSAATGKLLSSIADALLHSDFEGIIKDIDEALGD